MGFIPEKTLAYNQSTAPVSPPSTLQAEDAAQAGNGVSGTNDRRLGVRRNAVMKERAVPTQPQETEISNIESAGSLFVSIDEAKNFEEMFNNRPTRQAPVGSVIFSRN